MKPRNKLEMQVAELSGKLPEISEAQLGWGKEHCFKHIAFSSGENKWCSECGMSWVDVQVQKDGYVKCPYCGKRLKIQASRKKNLNEDSYMTICTATGGFQVLRHVYIRKSRFGKDSSVYYFTSEVCQQWFTESGKEIIIAKPMNMCGTGFCYYSPMSIKKIERGWGYNGSRYDIHGYVYPKVRLIPILRKYGMKTSFHDVVPADLVRGLLLGNQTIETLLKTKQYDLLRYCVRRGGLEYRWAVNICNRNGYIVKDATMWIDYLHLLEYFRLDTHNAYYVCPKNLKKAHDKLLERKRRIEAEQRRERERIKRMKREEQMKKDIHAFIARMQKYFGMVFKDDDIVIYPLESVTQFYQEGKSMHHCVYENRYYSKPECLILSAQVNGKRTETVEVSLKTFKIIQSRAVCNGTSEYHDRIINIVNRNMDQIRRRAAG